MHELRTARTRAHLSQESLAAQAGISQVSIINYERGQVVPRPSIRRAIEQTLGERIDWVATKIGRPVDGNGGNTEEEQALRHVWQYIYGGSGHRRRLRWLRTLIDHLEATT